MAHVSIPAFGRFPEPRTVALLQHARWMSKPVVSPKLQEHMGPVCAVAPHVRSANATRSHRDLLPGKPAQRHQCCPFLVAQRIQHAFDTRMERQFEIPRDVGGRPGPQPSAFGPAAVVGMRLDIALPRHVGMA